MDDLEVWEKYPEYRIFHNKLWLAEMMNLHCGPSGIPVPYDDYYCVRPIYNLLGMGVGAQKKLLKKGETVQPGYFWCEWLEGDHISVDFYKKGKKWVQGPTYIAIKHPDDPLYKFRAWKRIDKKIPFPPMYELQHLENIKNLNFEAIGDTIIEIHLRHNPNPVEYSEFIPIWHSEYDGMDHTSFLTAGYKFIEAVEDGGGHLGDIRLGFYCK